MFSVIIVELLRTLESHSHYCTRNTMQLTIIQFMRQLRHIFYGLGSRMDRLIWGAC